MMYEHILILLMVGLATIRMAKKRGWNPRNRVLPTVQTKALGTQSTLTVALGVLTQTSDEDYRLLSLKNTYSIDNLDAVDGPIDIGVAHGDYTAAEVEEWIEATASWTRNDQIAAEQANRKCRRIGTFSEDGVLNLGRPVKTKLNWHVTTGENVNLWIYNHGPTLQTGAVIGIQGSALIQYAN